MYCMHVDVLKVMMAWTCIEARSKESIVTKFLQTLCWTISDVPAPLEAPVSTIPTWGIIIPARLLFLLAVTAFFVGNYYLEECKHLDDGSWVPRLVIWLCSSCWDEDSVDAWLHFHQGLARHSQTRDCSLVYVSMSTHSRSKTNCYCWFTNTQAQLPFLSFLFEPVPGLFPIAVVTWQNWLWLGNNWVERRKMTQPGPFMSPFCKKAVESGLIWDLRFRTAHFKADSAKNKNIWLHQSRSEVKGACQGTKISMGANFATLVL